MIMLDQIYMYSSPNMQANIDNKISKRYRRIAKYKFICMNLYVHYIK